VVPKEQDVPDSSNSEVKKGAENALMVDKVNGSVQSGDTPFAVPQPAYPTSHRAKNFVL